MLWRVDSDTVEELTPVDGNLTGVSEGDDERVHTVTVDKDDGWILIDVADPEDPDVALLRVERNGTLIPADRVWREDGRVLVLDDPETEYDLVYADEGGLFGAGLVPWLPIYGAVVLIIALIAGLVVARRVRQGDFTGRDEDDAIEVYFDEDEEGAYAEEPYAGEPYPGEGGDVVYAERVDADEDTGFYTDDEGSYDEEPYFDDEEPHPAEGY